MSLPRGPRGQFLVGHLTEFRRDRLDFMTRCARDYGDIVPLRLLGTSSAREVAELYTALAMRLSKELFP